MTDFITRAAEFAAAAHASIDQRRKYTNEPYIVHPKSVADIVACVTDDETTIAAAWLHDGVEGTPVTLQEIENEFGEDVAKLVHDLTNVDKPEDGNRAARKAINRRHSAKADPRAKTVKLADVIDNLSDLAEQDIGFARKYAEEKALLLKVLTEGDRQLMKRAKEIIKWIRAT